MGRDWITLGSAGQKLTDVCMVFETVYFIFLMLFYLVVESFYILYLLVISYRKIMYVDHITSLASTLLEPSLTSSSQFCHFLLPPLPPPSLPLLLLSSE